MGGRRGNGYCKYKFCFYVTFLRTTTDRNAGAKNQTKDFRTDDETIDRKERHFLTNHSTNDNNNKKQQQQQPNPALSDDSLYYGTRLQDTSESGLYRINRKGNRLNKNHPHRILGVVRRRVLNFVVTGGIAAFLVGAQVS
jgi:hypothetical protein